MKSVAIKLFSLLESSKICRRRARYRLRHADEYSSNYRKQLNVHCTFRNFSIRPTLDDFGRCADYPI
uniref:Uncharacterized protein n=1 Tax=Romanomermis culicivorax TaxID=13658 RepID=A0A915K9Q2_ROMCU